MGRSELAPKARRQPEGPRTARRRMFGAAVVAAALPGTIACNAILGLDDFDKVECPGRVCPYDGGDAAPDGFRPDAGDGGDATPSRGVDPVSWARFPMPNYVVEAGVAPPNPPQLEVNGDTVEEHRSGRVWQKAVLPGGQVTLDDALKGCASLGTPGDWRLPKRIELVTLLAYEKQAPFIHPAFTGVKNVRVWTSSEARPFDPNAPNYWFVDFNTGTVESQAADLVANVLCVKAK